VVRDVQNTNKELRLRIELDAAKRKASLQRDEIDGTHDLSDTGAVLY